MKLQTGWKQWDRFLSEFVDKRINCLDIGCLEGASTCWMLDNLCTNVQSHVFSIDTWEGGPDYTTNVNFNSVEQTFDNNVNKTGRRNQNVKIKMLSSEGLVYLRRQKYLYFDFIFIDASHTAKDVISDAILSWELLATDGVMIFDDYKWEKLNKDYFCPKLAIDSFVHIFKPEISILYEGYQYIIKKKQSKMFEQPKSNKIYELIDKIAYFNFNDLNISYDTEITSKLNYKITMNTDMPLYINNKMYDRTIYHNKCDDIEKYNFFHLFHVDEPLKIIKKTYVS